MELSAFIDEMTNDIGHCEELTEDRIWNVPGPMIWKANCFTGSPHFYPVYRCGESYSYSPLALIVQKHKLHINRRVAHAVAKPVSRYYSGNDTVDLDINRIGGPMERGHLQIKDPNQFVERIAHAMQEDIVAVENRNSGHTNIILCGGMDSLNLLLLPWKNPVVAASAPPNYEVVKQFISDNGLHIDLICLNDDDTSLLDIEILINCCRNNLQHFRWGPHLRKIAQEFESRTIFWKGQLGMFLKGTWANYSHPRDVGVYLSHIPVLFDVLSRQTPIMQRYFYWSLWRRGAMWQGAHMSFIRHLTGGMCLSAYHGTAMRRVLSSVDLRHALPYDIRPLLGEYLAGAPIQCPSTNPSPALSAFRDGKSHLAPFLEMVKRTGIPTIT